MKKGTITKILMLSGALLLAASCSPDGGAGSSGTVKIMFHVDIKSAEGQAYKKRIDAFNAAYKEKGIKASASYIARTAGASAYETDLMNKQTEGTLPDIVTFDAPNCASYAKSGLLYDITEMLTENEKSDFVSLNTYNNENTS